MLTDFLPWIKRWALTPDGEPFVTAYSQSRLLPVRHSGRAAMLKLAVSDDERRGSTIMAWWDGRGAAPVLRHADNALLMARGEGVRSLAEAPDEVALPILCGVAAALHARRPDPPSVPPLAQLFPALLDGGEPRLEGARRIARELLATTCDEVLLHADIHHSNVLDFGDEGWLAIDPWGYRGERAYDYANVLRNPNLVRVTEPGRFDSGRALIAEAAGLDPERLLRWIYAHAGLAASWDLMDGQKPDRSFAVLELAEARL
ncbi:aminoglycoside phosphotransferase family protein [Phenylobacterium sp.]|uniref:aminoglycoside phosphotransferase family protein n=1 Tax=Phenylobacterium sp. TaxID=1871053 RepID=UPI003BA99606